MNMNCECDLNKHMVSGSKNSSESKQRSVHQA